MSSIILRSSYWVCTFECFNFVFFLFGLLIATCLELRECTIKFAPCSARYKAKRFKN